MKEEQPEEPAAAIFKMLRVQFLPDSFTFRDVEKANLRIYANVLMEYPELKLQIKGHAARFGSEETSQELSEQRARVVADFILNESKLTEDRLTVFGVGSKEPRGDNSTVQGRVLNRRVEISVVQ